VKTQVYSQIRKEDFFIQEGENFSLADKSQLSPCSEIILTQNNGSVLLKIMPSP
jgi:hypothetical protein